MRPHLDYGEIIYDKFYVETFHQKLESTQYNICLALSGAIKELSREKFLPWIRLGFPPMSTLVQETVLIKDFQRKWTYLPFQSNTNKKFQL